MAVRAICLALTAALLLGTYTGGFGHSEAVEMCTPSFWRCANFYGLVANPVAYAVPVSSSAGSAAAARVHKHRWAGGLPLRCIAQNQQKVYTAGLHASSEVSVCSVPCDRNLACNVWLAAL
jgi:hypothetical protein